MTHNCTQYTPKSRKSRVDSHVSENVSSLELVAQIARLENQIHQLQEDIRKTKQSKEKADSLMGTDQEESTLQQRETMLKQQIEQARSKLEGFQDITANAGLFPMGETISRTLTNGLSRGR